MQLPDIFTEQRKTAQNASVVRRVEMDAVVPAVRPTPRQHVPAAAIIWKPSDGKELPWLGRI